MPNARSNEPCEIARSRRLILSISANDADMPRKIEAWLSANAPGASYAFAEVANPSRKHGAPMVAVAIEGLLGANLALIQQELTVLGHWELAIDADVLQSAVN